VLIFENAGSDGREGDISPTPAGDDHSHLADIPTPRRRGCGPDQGPRIRAGDDGCPRPRRAGRRYAETCIAFTPRSEAERFRSTVGQVKLGPHPDTTGWSDGFACHIGGPEVTAHCPSKAEIDALVLRDFHLLVAEHGMKPVVVHNALLELIEFRRAIHETAYGSVNQGKPRVTNAVDRPL
jgi:hypothetical protein